MKKALLIGMMAFTACAVQPAQPVRLVSFDHLKPYEVNVAHVDARVMTGSAKGSFIADPAKVLEQYMQSRFLARGSRNGLEATVEEATVVKQEQPSSNRVARYLNVDGSDVYNITLRVRFEHKDSAGATLYGKVLTARRTMHISEHASVADREKTEIVNLERMFGDIDREVTHMVIEDMRLGM